METRIYAGMISEGDYGDNSEALFLSNSSEPLTMRVENDIDELGVYLSVRYFISDRRRTLEELEKRLISRLYGDGRQTVYEDRYTETSGYQWTDEEMMVGGHDLINELRSSVGKYCHLEIGYSHTGQDALVSLGESDVVTN